MKKKYYKKGSVLTLTLIFSIILSFSGMAYLYLTSIERISQSEQTSRTLSFYAAEAGVERACSWIMYLGGYPEVILGRRDVYFPFGSAEIFLNTQPKMSSYIVSVYPDQSNDVDKSEAYYTIVSTGFAGNISKCVIRKLKLINLLKFAYFSDIENESVDPPELAYFATPDKFDGPVHSNDRIYIAGNPSFSDIDHNGILDVTSAEGFSYYQDRVTILLPEEKHKVHRIPLLEKFNLERLRNIAIQMQSVGRGLVLEGNQKIEIQGDILKYGTNGTNEWIIPASSGIVFVNNGEIRIKGNNLRRWLTIVSSSRIIVTDDVRYKQDSKGMLALIAKYDIEISTLIPHLYVDGCLVALEGKFYARDWRKTSNVDNYLHIFGSLVQKKRYYVGQAYPDPGAGKVATGYNKDYKYDNRVLSKPPPFFPISIVNLSIEWRELPAKRR